MNETDSKRAENISVCKVVDTNVAQCQDCYRCVRACPVKAIRITNSQAHIEQSLCIHCGTCVRQCPQHAKYILSTLDEVHELLDSGRTVAASVAPSFAAALDSSLLSKIPTALRLLGFSYVSETAEGAMLVSSRSLEAAKNGSICTACPAVVSYVEKYRHEALPRMIPVVSPMVAHGRMLKKAYGEDCAVVFIGPCAAKKAEALRPENRDAIDAVITFRELFDWLEEEGIKLPLIEDGEFDFTGLSGGTLENARLFPVDGGMLKTCGAASDGTSTEVMSLSGAKQVTSFFDVDPEKVHFKLVEPLFCPGGCIDGPGFPDIGNIYYRKNAVIAYAESKAQLGAGEKDPSAIATDAEFASLNTHADEQVSEEAIQNIYQMTGKTNPANQLNCGACGYSSCRENAIAVVRGMAEIEMCIPYMRRLARQRADRVIETTPTAVVIVDKDLNLIHMNPAFHKMFMCSNSILGRHISYIFDAQDFETLASGETDKLDAIRTYYGTRYHETIYAMRDEEQYVGIFTDLSHMKFDEGQMNLIKKQLLDNAKELLEHQISFSQEMAHQLGRNTAKTEELVKRMLDLYEDPNF